MATARYSIPKIYLIGYGREQARQFVCHSCSDLFFFDGESSTLDALFCEACLDQPKAAHIKYDDHPYIDVVGFKQKTDSRSRRSLYNYKKVAKRDNYTCQYCGYSPRLFVDFIPMHVDHIRPFCNGGGNKMSNLVMACRTCNLHLSGKVFGDFHDKLAFIVDWRKENGEPYTERQWARRAALESPESPED